MFSFEWHPKTQKMYRIDIPGETIDGVFIPSTSGNAKGFCIAEHVEHHARAYGFVQTFCRAYLLALKNNSKKEVLDPCPIR